MKMVKLMNNPLKGILKARRGHSAESIISDWRLKSQLAPLETSIVPRELALKPQSNEPTSLNMNLNVKTLDINSSFETMKIDRSVSEYWSNMLRYHWPIVVQSIFLIIIIVILGPWIGLRCNQDIGIHPNYNKFSLWPLDYSSPGFRASGYSYGGCNYGLYCGGMKTTDGELVRRKASFLKRKRNLKELID